MKISPVANPQGQAALSHAGVDVGRSASPERLAAAKAIARGEAPPAATDPQVARAEASINKIRMRTQLSPDRYAPETPVDATEVAETEESAESTLPHVEKEANDGLEETKPLSPQFAALAKQKRALDVRERALAEREKALETSPSTTGVEEFRTRLKSEPLRVLLEEGVTYDQLTEAILANQSGINPEIQALKQEIKALKEGVDKTLSDKDQAAKNAVLTEMRKEAEILAKEGDSFELIRETKSTPDVIDLIQRTYDETGEILDVREAMELVEKELLEDSLRVAQFQKVKSQLAPTPAVVPQPAVTQQRQIRTLTNRDGAMPVLGKRERAIAAALGQLKR